MTSLWLHFTNRTTEPLKIPKVLASSRVTRQEEALSGLWPLLLHLHPHCYPRPQSGHLCLLGDKAETLELNPSCLAPCTSLAAHPHVASPAAWSLIRVILQSVTHGSWDIETDKVKRTMPHILIGLDEEFSTILNKVLSKTMTWLQFLFDTGLTAVKQ